VNRQQVKWIAIIWLAFSVPVAVVLWMTSGRYLALMMVYFLALPIYLSIALWGLRYPVMTIEWLSPKVINIWRVILGLPTRR
jgi:hypothetical protein